MPNPHRVPKEVTRERERRAWELRQQLWTHERIALELGVDHSTITKMLARIRQRMLVQLNVEVGSRVAEQVGQLDQIADQSYQAWIKSKEPEKEVQKKVSKGKGLRSGSEETSSRVSERGGDVRYLEMTVRALQDIRKILGIEAPVRQQNVSLTLDDLKSMTDDELERLAKGEPVESVLRAKT